METILQWVMVYSSLYGVDPRVVLATIAVESGFDHSMVGPVGELGLMQVRPEYAAVSRRLLKTRVMNLKEGIRKLAEAKDGCLHQRDYAWLVCYNAGVSGGSRLRHPKQFGYYKRFMKEFKAMQDGIFKPGQRVVILKGHAHGSADSGVIIKKGTERWKEDKWLVDLGDNRHSYFDEAQLVDEMAYWEKEHEKRQLAGQVSRLLN